MNGSYCVSTLEEMEQDGCMKDYMTITSQANYGIEVDGFATVLAIFFSIFLACFFSWAQVHVSDKAQELDAENDVPDDFTVMVMNLPKNQNEKKIAKYFEELMDRGAVRSSIVVEQISVGYELKDLKKLKYALDNNRKQMIIQLNRELRAQKINPGEQFNEEDLSKDFKAKKLAFEQAQEAYDTEVYQLGKQLREDVTKETAFVTFQTKLMANIVINAFGNEKPWYIRIWNYFFADKTRRVYHYEEGGVAKRAHLRVYKAPDPTEIVWENLGIDFNTLFKRRMATLIASLLVLGICFGFLLLLKVYQRKQRESATPESSTFMFRTLSVVISLTISIVNWILSFSMKYFTQLEKHYTLTTKNASLVLKVSLTQFFNTCLMILAVHMWLVTPSFKIWEKGGLLSDAFFIILNDITITPMMDFLDIGYYLKKFKQSSLKKSYKSSSLTQEECNKAFEGNEMDLSIIYAKFIKSIYASLFFLPILPIASVTCFISMGMNYWIYKHRLLRTAKLPASIGHSITVLAIKFVKRSPFIIAVEHVY